MNKQQAKRQRDLKNKLMAAICMLLVSSIMMVSTTYAWFTLSTAPEVTGINTAVGANGNLEMALLPTDAITGTTKKDADYGITANVGDSLQPAPIKNVTWGNLVDLRDASYGLTKISLYPAALNTDSTTDADGKVTKTLKAAMLQTPQYGADGRVSNLAENTVTSTYVLPEGNFPNNSLYGVRAVGTAAGMTNRQLTYRNAQSEGASAMSQAKNDASKSLNTNGAALANIAMAHHANEGATFTQDDVASLRAIVNDLKGTTDKTGALQYIETAYIQYIIAYVASAANTTMDDTAFDAFKSTASEKETAQEVVALIQTAGGTVPAEVTTALSKLADTKTAVDNANNALANLTGEEITWLQISNAMGYLVDTTKLTINDFAINDIKNNLGQVVSSMPTYGGVVVKMPTGGGVYADIADHCGNYTASIQLKNISAGGFRLEEMDAKMQTASSAAYLTAVASGVSGAGAPAGATGKAMPVTDMYGYIIDLGFRTNAADSNLLLQTDAVDRIYETSTGAVQEDGTTTMGGGSTMTFAAVSNDFNNEQVAALMAAIRIVFFDTSTSKILATAMLDTTTAEIGADGTTMDIVLYKDGITTTTTTYEAATGEDAKYIADASATATGGYRLAVEGETATHKQVVTTTTAPGTTKLSGNDAIITALNQNVAQAVSVLVYLDGTQVDNADVSATGSKSVTGTMNLQFASSAALTPMNYTPLTQQTGTTATTATTTPASSEPAPTT